MRFSLPVDSQACLAVYSTTGQRVGALVDGETAPGSHALVWDGRDETGRLVASGTYLYQLEAGGRRTAGRITFAR